MCACIECLQASNPNLIGNKRKQSRTIGHAQVRGHVEAQISLVATGKAEKAAVVLHTLAQFAVKFRFFVAHIGRMDALFEASFSPLASSGLSYSSL